MIMKTVKINRRHWLRGDSYRRYPESKGPALYDEYTERGCCLGHALHQIHDAKWKEMCLGMPSEYFDNKYSDDFGNLVNPIENLFVETSETGTFTRSSNLSNVASDINDNKTINDAEREERLKLVFRSHGINLEFVGH